MQALRGPFKIMLAVCLGLLCAAMAYELGWQRGREVAEMEQPAPEWTIMQNRDRQASQSRRHQYDANPGVDQVVTPAAAGRRR